MISVVVVDIATQNVEKTFEMDLNSKPAREGLYKKLMVWAFLNKKSVHIKNKNDEG